MWGETPNNPVYTKQGTSNLIREYKDILLALLEHDLCGFVTVVIFV